MRLFVIFITLVVMLGLVSSCSKSNGDEWLSELPDNPTPNQELLNNCYQIAAEDYCNQAGCELIEVLDSKSYKVFGLYERKTKTLEFSPTEIQLCRAIER